MYIKDQSLTPAILKIVCQRGTELPHSALLTAENKAGTYLCRACGLALFRASQKFNSGCGWPSFDQEIAGAVQRQADADGLRVEIVCARCQGHLGHVFQGEGFTPLNTRHCVNALSLDFVPGFEVEDTKEAILAGGCFWGVEYLLKQLPGVLKTEVGYCGGTEEAPSYHQVCSGSTGYLEAVRVIYDPAHLSYEALLKYFLEIHDPTQGGGQGPDRGSQYVSAIFYYDEAEKQVAEHCLVLLREQGLLPLTTLRPSTIFWPAEADHQNYYEKTGHLPYCHVYTKRFK